MNSTTIPAEITAFANAVRDALKDLSAEEVDDLTDGLEADLAEEYAGEHPRALPSATAYAMELRTAAGLPPGAARKTGFSAGVVGVLRRGQRTWGDALGSARENPAVAAALDFLAVLAPAWWLARAYLVTWALMLLFSGVFGGFAGLTPTNGFILVLIVCVVVSVQWGRGRWTFRGHRLLGTAANIVAAILLPFLVGDVLSDSGYDPYAEEYYDDVPSGYGDIGHALEEAGVSNIYAYDAQGQPLVDVQLFDQDGRPLNPNEVGERLCVDDGPCAEAQPARLVTGASAWNVFPQPFTPVEDEMGELAEGNPLVTPPFVMVPAVDGIDADESPASDDAEVTQSPDNDKAEQTSTPTSEQP